MHPTGKPQSEDVFVRVARAIAAAGRQLLPSEFGCSEFAGDVWLGHQGQAITGSGVASTLEWRIDDVDGEEVLVKVERVEPGEVVRVAEHFLDRMQDFVTEMRAGLGFPAIPWPPVPDKPLGEFADGRAELRDGELRLGGTSVQGGASPMRTASRGA